MITLLDEQRRVVDKGGTMRLGSYPCRLVPGTMAREAYGVDEVHGAPPPPLRVQQRVPRAVRRGGPRRQRHVPDGALVEICEIRDHAWMVGSQFHPELRSRPNRPHPLFVGLRRRRRSSSSRSRARARAAAEPHVAAGASARAARTRTPQLAGLSTIRRGVPLRAYPGLRSGTWPGSRPSRSRSSAAGRRENIATKSGLRSRRRRTTRGSCWCRARSRRRHGPILLAQLGYNCSTHGLAAARRGDVHRHAARLPAVRRHGPAAGADRRAEGAPQGHITPELEQAMADNVPLFFGGIATILVPCGGLPCSGRLQTSVIKVARHALRSSESRLTIARYCASNNDWGIF